MEQLILPNIIIGEKEADEAVDWRNIETDDTEDTDEELEETPEDVIEGLGFDPKEIEEITEDANFKETEHPRGQPDNPGQFVEKGAGASKPSSMGNVKFKKVDSKNQERIKNILSKIKSSIPEKHLKYVSEFNISQTERNFGEAGGKAGKIGSVAANEKTGPISLEIQFPKSNKTLSNKDIEEIISHEIGHKVFAKLDNDTKQDWIKAARQIKMGLSDDVWFKKNAPYVIEANKNASSITSKSINKEEAFTNELFAELYSLYSRNPKLVESYLKKRAESLKKIFEK